MFNLDEEKDRLTKELSVQFSRSEISMEEYERILEYINRIETKKEISVIEKIIQENSIAEKNGLEPVQSSSLAAAESKESHLSMFSWRTSTVKPSNGSGGKYTSLFGANRIIVDKLPRGKTVIHITAVFGLAEIIVPENVKIINRAVPVFAGIFAPDETGGKDESLPELYITGKAVFGNITIKRTRNFEKEKEQEHEFEEKVKEKIMRKIYDKM